MNPIELRRSDAPQALGGSTGTVMRHWQANGLTPHIVRGLAVSRDPKPVEKLKDIAGLCMSPPERAPVLCCDEKSPVQTLHLIADDPATSAI